MGPAGTTEVTVPPGDEDCTAIAAVIAAPMLTEPAICGLWKTTAVAVIVAISGDRAAVGFDVAAAAARAVPIGKLAST